MAFGESAMITISICLIYYSVALFLYQVYGWLSLGVWTQFPVVRAWEGFFGAPGLAAAPFDSFLPWFMALPLSLVLLFGGVSLLAMIYGFRLLAEKRRDRMRIKWILKQCKAAGYKPWAVPRVIRELDDQLRNERLARQEKF